MLFKPGWYNGCLALDDMSHENAFCSEFSASFKASLVFRRLMTESKAASLLLLKLNMP